jgi:hypothetical protein
MSEAEVDECYVGCVSRKAEGVGHKRGRSHDGKVVLLGAVDRNTGMATAEEVPDTKGITLRSFVSRVVN